MFSKHRTEFYKVSFSNYDLLLKNNGSCTPALEPMIHSNILPSNHRPQMFHSDQSEKRDGSRQCLLQSESKDDIVLRLGGRNILFPFLIYSLLDKHILLNLILPILFSSQPYSFHSLLFPTLFLPSSSLPNLIPPILFSFLPYSFHPLLFPTLFLPSSSLPNLISLLNSYYFLNNLF